MYCLSYCHCTSKTSRSSRYPYSTTSSHFSHIFEHIFHHHLHDTAWSSETSWHSNFSIFDWLLGNSNSLLSIIMYFFFSMSSIFINLLLNIIIIITIIQIRVKIRTIIWIINFIILWYFLILRLLSWDIIRLTQNRLMSYFISDGYCINLIHITVWMT